MDYPEKELHRLMIWLGDDLFPILDKILAMEKMRDDEYRFIARFTSGRKVRDLISKI
jgi:hypothetical protein